MPGLTALRAFAARKTYVERCGLCAAALEGEHEHVVERGGRSPLCACRGCAVLFEADSPRYRRVPREARRFASFDLPEELWSRLEVPVDLVFFQKSGASGRVTAFYPSPAGVLESLLPLDAWTEVAARNPALAGLREDVEALLADRVGEPPAYFLAPLDECFRLIGIIRSSWRGMTGGEAVKTETRRFFQELGARAARV